MDVVLTQDIPNLGRKGAVVSVKNGYFRNFLGPRGKAIRVTGKLMKQLEEQKQQMMKRREAMIEKAEEFTKRIEAMTVTFKRKTTKKEKLYAAITEDQIQRELEKHLKFDLEKGSVHVAEPIKALGEYTATISLTESITATLKVVVESE